LLGWSHCNSVYRFARKYFWGDRRLSGRTSGQFYGWRVQTL